MDFIGKSSLLSGRRMVARARYWSPSFVMTQNTCAGGALVLLVPLVPLGCTYGAMVALVPFGCAYAAMVELVPWEM